MSGWPPADSPPSALAEVVRFLGVDQAAPAGTRSLELHEGIVEHPRCDRWPERLRLVDGDGRRVRGRCRATNLCEYCRRLYTIETVEMLALDAVEYAPTVWVVLTAREHLTRAECRLHLDQLRKSVRKRWPAVEWFVQVEFQRRGALHLNLLVKGVPAEDAQAFTEAAAALWCSRVDAERVGQWGDAVLEGGAVNAIKYLSKMLAHGLKAEQAPPIGWQGHRTSHTRGYLVRPTWQMRREARESLAFKRALWRAEQEGRAGPDALEEAELEVATARDREWVLAVAVMDVETGEIFGWRPALRRGSVDDVMPAAVLKLARLDLGGRVAYSETSWRALVEGAT